MSNAFELEHGDWELRLGDCLDPVTGLASLPDGCAEHVLSDPPYSEHVHANLGRERCADGRQVDRDALTFSCLTDEMAAAVSLQACRTVTRWIVVFCDEAAVFIWRREINSSGGLYVRGGTWVKTDAMPQMTGDRPAAGTEAIVIAHAPRESGRMKWNGGGRPATWLGSKSDGTAREHPTQKPAWLMEALVRDFTDPGDLVLDPFAGSGTTGVACRRLGRRFLGWERDPKFHAAALKRIGAARQQLGLLERAKAPKVEQGDMFKPGKAVRS